MARSSEDIKKLVGQQLKHLAGLDFSCGAGVRMLDVDARLSGDVTGRLQPRAEGGEAPPERRALRQE